MKLQATGINVGRLCLDLSIRFPGAFYAPGKVTIFLALPTRFAADPEKPGV